MRITFTSIFLLCGTILLAQSSGVEKTLFDTQTGILGFWINNESRISNTFALRTEIGLDAELFDHPYRKAGILLAPGIALEPRWYYNIDRRSLKGKNIDNNAANFVTIGFAYHPDWFVISSDKYLVVPDQITVIPKWAIRRNIGQSNFNYEVGIGLGVRSYIGNKYMKSVATEAAIDLHARIGYTFYKSKNNK